MMCSLEKQLVTPISGKAEKLFSHRKCSTKPENLIPTMKRCTISHNMYDNDKTHSAMVTSTDNGKLYIRLDTLT